MSKTLESLVALTCVAILLTLGAMALVQLTPDAHAAGVSASVVHTEPDIGTTRSELATDNGMRHFHYACCVDDAEAGTVYVGDSTVTTTDYGASFVAGECWGGPHGGEYAVASAIDTTIHCRYTVGGAL